MKILFSADWHIKLGQKNVPREWQKNRYTLFFDKLKKLENRCDIHIVGGDIFDKLPTPEELAIYFDFISNVDIPTYIYDGNHEASRRGKTFFEFLVTCTESINSKAKVLLGISKIHDIDIIPYTHIKKFNPKDFSGNILCTHVRGEIKPHVQPEIDLSLLDRWDVVLAGDLHSYENSQRNIIYPGSPMSITFHRTKIKNGVIIFDTDTMKHEWVDLGLPQLIRKTVDTEDEVIKTEYDHTIYEIVGNALNLTSVDNKNSLIDKKIISKSNSSKLNLKDMDIIEELQMYLKEVQELKDSEIKEVLGVFNDYFKDIDVG